MELLATKIDSSQFTCYKGIERTNERPTTKGADSIKRTDGRADGRKEGRKEGGRERRGKIENRVR